jgi:hypothetical protein
MIYLAMLILLGGCATGGHVAPATTTVAPAEMSPPGLAEVRALAEKAGRAYGMPAPAIMVADHAGDATFGAVYRRGVITFTARALAGPNRDKIAAHEIAHYVLRHDLPGMRTQEEKEHAANIEAVRILQLAGRSEEQATREVLAALDRTRQAVGRGATIARGHAHPCEEIHAVVVAYPAQRAWSVTFECVRRQ